MRYLNIVICLITLVLCACTSPPKLERTPSLAGNYVVDPAHTSVVWRISHVGLSNYTARFDKVSGVLLFDAEKPQNSKIDIRIDPTSVHTGDADFDKTLANERKYFDAKTYSEIRFVSNDIKITGKNSGDVHGDLSFRGHTKPVTLMVTYNGAGKSFGHKGQTLGFSATATLSRSDFGLTTLKAFGIGDEVTLQIETEFNES